MKRKVFLFAGLAFLIIGIQAQTVMDYDGNLYDTVVIGTQAWFKQNLKVTHYNNGTPIPLVIDTVTWAGLTTGARCYYANDSSSYDSIYGPLYNWHAVNDSNSICPEGWRVSSIPDWQAAESSLGGFDVAGGAMKESGTLHWASPNTGATNSSGFTGLPGGMRDPVQNNFRTLTENGLWWTTTAYNSSAAWSVYMWYLNTGIDHNPTPKTLGLSIRCVKDVATGTGNKLLPRKIKIYPVPAENRITIEYYTEQNQELRVFDLYGKMVLCHELTKQINQIDISALKNGIYILMIDDDQGPVLQKLVKK
jgi:uncharacterized protein (TIGR02145 family)